jgi:glycosyltransferase involved in cell wall biosynthesis
MTDKEVSVIIPAFNEEESLKDFIESLKSVLITTISDYEIIIVDDGSTDNTYPIVSNIKDIKVVRHPYNKGNGAAVKSGILEAQGERIVVIDADGQHDPEQITEMLRFLDENDLVVGARGSFGIGRRGLGNVIVSKLASYLAGVTIPDLTSGFRAFKKDKMMEFISLLPNGYSLPSTSTLAFATSGYNIKFIPINIKKRQGGTSSIKVVRDGMKFLVLIVRMVSLFKPLKVFTPLSGLLVLMGIIWAVRTISYSSQITPTVAMLFLGGIFVFLFGLLADQIAEARLSIGKISKILMKGKNDGNG